MGTKPTVPLTTCPACGHVTDVPDRNWAFRIEKHGLLSGNQIKGNVKGRYGRTYRNERRFYESALSRRKVPKAEGFRQVLVTRYYGKRRRPFEYDNLVTGGKPLVDALRTKGFILDDKPNVANISYFQEKSADGSDYIEITIQEFDNG